MHRPGSPGRPAEPGCPREPGWPGPPGGPRSPLTTMGAGGTPGSPGGPGGQQAMRGEVENTTCTDFKKAHVSTHQKVQRLLGHRGVRYHLEVRGLPSALEETQHLRFLHGFLWVEESERVLNGDEPGNPGTPGRPMSPLEPGAPGPPGEPSRQRRRLLAGDWLKQTIMSFTY